MMALLLANLGTSVSVHAHQPRAAPAQLSLSPTLEHQQHIARLGVTTGAPSPVPAAQPDVAAMGRVETWTRRTLILRYVPPPETPGRQVLRNIYVDTYAPCRGCFYGAYLVVETDALLR